MECVYIANTHLALKVLSRERVNGIMISVGGRGYQNGTLSFLLFQVFKCDIVILVLWGIDYLLKT